MQDNPLWQYSLTVYRQPGVEALLVKLQDNHQADVNLLLCCAWLGSEGQVLSTEDLQSLLDVSSLWRQQCVKPLRGVRRFLKGRPGNEAFREQVKTLEIEAEQRQQALIYQRWQLLDLLPTETSAVAINTNLRLYGSLLGSADQEWLAQGLTDLAQLIK